MINPKTLDFWRAQCSKGYDMPVEVARDLIRAYDTQAATIKEAADAMRSIEGDDMRPAQEWLTQHGGANGSA